MSSRSHVVDRSGRDARCLERRAVFAPQLSIPRSVGARPRGGGARVCRGGRRDRRQRDSPARFLSARAQLRVQAAFLLPSDDPVPVR